MPEPHSRAPLGPHLYTRASPRLGLLPMVIFRHSPSPSFSIFFLPCGHLPSAVSRRLLQYRTVLTVSCGAPP
ncbi:hypothetical protein CALCODRAFT_232794 [Calocera cornea HHB12733]|uniref:Uncharacterized protein n=1 Tax=Calocera cornea HHB12733 TaxID=1353952 RepID=A0A165C079_9BASI|nr:hypothetical protein CALCODRAFT_232794 [Calocera cornea HHB12733]